MKEVNITARKEVKLLNTVIPSNHTINGVTHNLVKRTCGCGPYDEFVFSFQGELVTTTEKDWEQKMYIKKVVVNANKSI